jgi:hypothetical protein
MQCFAVRSADCHCPFERTRRALKGPKIHESSAGVRRGEEPRSSSAYACAWVVCDPPTQCVAAANPSKTRRATLLAGRILFLPTVVSRRREAIVGFAGLGRIETNTNVSGPCFANSHSTSGRDVRGSSCMGTRLAKRASNEALSPSSHRPFQPMSAGSAPRSATGGDVRMGPGWIRPLRLPHRPSVLCRRFFSCKWFAPRANTLGSV